MSPTAAKDAPHDFVPYQDADTGICALCGRWDLNGIHVLDPTPTAENDARSIIYIDAPLPGTVLAKAYRMNAEWDRRHRVTADERAVSDPNRSPAIGYVIPPERGQS